MSIAEERKATEYRIKLDVGRDIPDVPLHILQHILNSPDVSELRATAYPSRVKVQRFNHSYGHIDILFH